MSKHDFLVEIGTEELPPKALKSLAEAFQNGIEEYLKAKSLTFNSSKLFAAPRRLALRIKGLDAQGAESKIEKFGPYTNVAFDADGNPTKAAEGFARSNGISFDQVSRTTDDKGERLYYAQTVAGANAADELPVAITESLNKLPIPKRMRWGSSRIEFVRPVHWVLLLLDGKPLEADVLGVKSNYFTKGHRFHANREIAITSPDAYESILKEQGKVLADYEERKEMIRAQVKAEGEKLGGTAIIDEDLLDEVASLNEWPTALAGNFDKEFLDVPAEALISSMKEHQKYFHVVKVSGDGNSQLMPNFITVCNIESKDPQQVIEGNEKVIRPRLADAKFFWDTDRKQTLESRFNKLDTVVWVQKLGTLKDKSQRLIKLSAKIASAMGGDTGLAERAAKLAKTDLLSDMVYEFTDLQGLAGAYYAKHDGENAEVATAIKEQYQPAFAGDTLPETKTGTALALADRLDSLVGLFGIGQIPTGGKDPYALRRASLGVLRLLVEKDLNIDLSDLIDWAIEAYGDAELDANAKGKLIDYMLDRFSAMYQDQNIPTVVFQAVRAKGITQPLDINQRVQAVNAFYTLESAEALAAANKRVSNILTKNEAFIDAPSINEALLQEDAEKVLAKTLNEKGAEVAPLFEKGDYKAYLLALSSLRESIDAFFDNVMVMADNEAVKQNRLALLNQLRNLFLQVADISQLQA